MILLNETVSAQDFKIIPREYAADSMKLTNETTGEVTTYSIVATQDTYYLTFSKAVTLSENTFYKMVVYNGSNIVYRDLVFCTNQSTSTFSVHNGDYTTNTTDNDYITV